MHRLVMIPALGCDATLYEKVAPALAEEVEVQTVIADRPVIEACAAQVLAAVEGPFIALGTSFGGRVAFETALAAPERVEGLIVIGSSPGAPGDPAAGLRRSQRLRHGEFERVVAEMAAIISHLPGPNGAATRDQFIAMCRRQGAELIARQSDAMARRMDKWARLPEIQIPTLMLWGKYDQFSPADEGLKFASSVAHGRYVEFTDCGHFPTLEDPDESASAIDHWLEDHNFISR